MESALLGRVVTASLAGGALGLVLWTVCRRWRLPPAAQTWLWWAVCLKLVLSLALPAIPLAVLPAETGFQPEPQPAVLQLAAAEPTSQAAVPAPARPRASGALPSWRRVLLALWLAGALAGAAVLFRRWLAVRAILRRAKPIDEPRILAAFERLRRELGVRRASLRGSEEIASPLVTGLWRPVVLLPAWPVLGDRELAMVLHHELQHVRRGDLWLAAVPALAERLFFFHPVARLAAREYEIGREAACDATVIAGRRERTADYGRLLLRLASTPAVSAVAPAARRPTLKRRLQMLTQNPRPLPTAAAAVLVGALLLALAPIRLTARSAALEPSDEWSRPALATAADASPAAEVSPTAASSPAPSASPQPQAPPMAPTAPMPPAAPTAGAGYADSSSYAYSYSYGHDSGEEAWVLIQDKGSWVHGSRGDRERAQQWQQGGEPLLWVRRGERAWVIRDPEVLASVHEIFAPQRDLGRQQGELGEMQGKLGDQQGALGGQMGELGEQMGELAEQHRDLAIQQMELNAQLLRNERGDATSASREEIRQRLREVEERQRELGQRQSELGERMSELGERQGELGERQGELGQRQGELGQRQAEAAERANLELRELVDEALAAGKAEPAD